MRTRSNTLIVIPIHKTELTNNELFSIQHSLSTLSNWPSCFIVPESLPISGLHTHFRQTSVVRFPDSYFKSTEDYSRLLIQEHFYKKFLSFEFILILQPDAIIFRDELGYWCEQPYDYIGAPWYNGYEFSVNLDQFCGNRGRVVRMHVGNGGLSLRRTQSCINLIKEFPESNQYFHKTGSNEDFFFGLLGALSNNFEIPNEVTASRFSMEHQPEYYYNINGSQLPMGAHGWSSLAPEFWLRHLPELRSLVSL